MHLIHRVSLDMKVVFQFVIVACAQMQQLLVTCKSHFDLSPCEVSPFFEGTVSRLLNTVCVGCSQHMHECGGEMGLSLQAGRH